MTERFMWARLTAEGTACAETALCITHRSQWPAYQGDETGPESERPVGVHVDCSGNEQLRCQVCGNWAGKIQFTNINPHIEAGTGEGYFFTYNGHEYVVECWATEITGGEDIYEVGTGRQVNIFEQPFDTTDDEAEFEEKLERIKKEWAQAHADLVFPAEQQAIQRTLRAIGAPELDMEGSASRQHYIETGRYLAPGEEES